MSRCNTIIAAALAAAALATPSALAQPPDIHTGLSEPAPKAQTKQDLRSPDTRDAARPETAGNPNVSAGVDQPAQARDDDKNAAPGDDATPAEAALGQERYYMSFGENAATDAKVAPVAPVADPALAHEHYQASDGNPTPVTDATRADPGNGIAQPPFVIAVLGALVVGLGAGSGLHLAHARRRATRLAT